MKFELGANFGASGGYGPNQVSTLLGLGVLITGFVYLWKLPPLINRRTDLLLMILFAVRALLTFSRGGLLVAILIVVLAYLSMLIIQRRLSAGRIFSLGLFGILIVAVSFSVNSITGGALLQRFKGETYATSRGLEKKDASSISSGRSDILRTDIEMFLDYPIFGVGLGVSNQLRPEYGYNNNSHIEQSRLLAEHGLFGFVFLLCLIFFPLSAYFSRKGLNQSILLIFTLLAFLTMAHSATRLAMVGLYFGFGFIKIYFEKPPLRRQPAVETRVHAHDD
jgi:O-antigen ligase